MDLKKELKSVHSQGLPSTRKIHLWKEIFFVKQNDWKSSIEDGKLILTKNNVQLEDSGTYYCSGNCFSLTFAIAYAKFEKLILYLEIPRRGDHFGIIHNDFKRSTNWAILNHGRFNKVKNSKIPRIKPENFAQNRPEWEFDETIDR